MDPTARPRTAISQTDRLAGITISLCLTAGTRKVIAFSASLIALIALADWAVGNTVSLGILYVLPMIVAAVVLRPMEIGILSVFCSLLRSWFDTPGSRAEVVLRFVFAVAAYFSSGLFANALVRNRELVVDHLDKLQREQTRRLEAEQELDLLFESSPAAILTLDSRGIVVAANTAAQEMFAVGKPGLQGRAIAKYLPLLADALQLQIGSRVFHTAAQCQGRRENGEIFLADTWFSSYASHEGMYLSAIVVDSSEEMRDREEQNLRELLNHNRIAAAALSHEVRNLCGAMHLVSSNLKDKHDLVLDDDFQGLRNLICGLERIASFNLYSQLNESLEEVPLQMVLDNLRIIIESEWHEMGGFVQWPPPPMPKILGDPHGLLQALLNLVQNSYRAVQDRITRKLLVTVSESAGRAFIRLEDSGPGVSAPERLFQPFQPGTNGAGLGLYISRSILRTYGGELRFEPRPTGSCFVVELQLV